MILCFKIIISRVKNSKFFTESIFTLKQIKLLFMKDAHEESDMVRGLIRNEVNVSVVEMKIIQINQFLRHFE